MSVTDRYCQHCGQDNSPEAVAKLIGEREEKRGKYMAFPRKIGAIMGNWDSSRVLWTVFYSIAIVYVFAFVSYLVLHLLGY